MNEQVLIGNEVQFNISQIESAVEAVSAFTEGEINSSNIKHSEKALRNLLNFTISHQLKLSIVILFIVFFGMTPDEVNAQVSVPDNVTPIAEIITSSATVSNLRVRLEPNGEILDHLKAGEEVRIIGYDTATGQWAYVDYKDGEEADGFVFSGYLSVNGTRVLPEISTRTVTMSGVSCGADGAKANDSADRLCAFPYGGSMIYYAHNYTNFGKTILGLSSNIGAKVSVYSDGTYLGEYEVVSSHKATGTSIQNIISTNAANSVDNQFISFVTTDPTLENADPYARWVVTLELVVE